MVVCWSRMCVPFTLNKKQGLNCPHHQSKQSIEGTLNYNIDFAFLRVRYSNQGIDRSMAIATHAARSVGPGDRRHRGCASSTGRRSWTSGKNTNPSEWASGGGVPSPSEPREVPSNKNTPGPGPFTPPKFGSTIPF